MNEPQVVVVLMEIGSHLCEAQHNGLVKEKETDMRAFHYFWEGDTMTAHLLLLCPDALWVQVPVRVQVSSSNTEVFYCNGGAICQVCTKRMTGHYLTPLQNTRINEIKWKMSFKTPVKLNNHGDLIQQQQKIVLTLFLQHCYISGEDRER